MLRARGLRPRKAGVYHPTGAGPLPAGAPHRLIAQRELAAIRVVEVVDVGGYSAGTVDGLDARSEGVHAGRLDDAASPWLDAPQAALRIRGASFTSNRAAGSRRRARHGAYMHRGTAVRAYPILSGEESYAGRTA